MFVSVVMGVYNGQEYLQEAIDSILNQSHTNFEFIIVDDGSTDQTRNILNNTNDSRVRTIHLEPNQGLAISLNIGIEAAKSEWILRQDADDISLPNRIAEQVNFIKSNPHLIALGTHLKCFANSPLIPEYFLESIQNYHNSLQSEEAILAEKFHSCPLSHGTMMFSKKAFIQANKYNPKYSIVQDYDLWMRMFEIGSIGMLPKILYKYRVEPSSLSHQDHFEFRREMREVSVTYLLRMLSKEFNKNSPLFVIIGPETTCKFIKEHICPLTGLKVSHYFYQQDKRMLDLSFHSFLMGKLDGIIILDDKDTNKSLQYLQKRGMTFNRNLFNLA